MQWSEIEHAWAAQPRDVLEALAHEGFAEYKLAVTRSRRDRPPTGGVWQRVIGPLTELSMVAAQENTRLAAELQIVALEALHDLYHRGYLQALDSMQRTLTSMGSTARLVTQAAERLQTAAIDAGRRVSETLESSVRESTRR